MSTTPQEIWLTRRDAAAYAQVSEATIGREVRSGRLRHARVGGRRSLRFRRHWIDDWLAAAQPVEQPTFAKTNVEVATAVAPRYIRSLRRSNAPLT
jgi:excisionase family DNA binding protein